MFFFSLNAVFLKRGEGGEGKGEGEGCEQDRVVGRIGRAEQKNSGMRGREREREDMGGQNSPLCYNRWWVFGGEEGKKIWGE